MKGRVIALSADPGHAALLIDGRLEDLLFTPKNSGAEVGEIRSARLTRKLPNESGAFVELGGGLIGYLREAKGFSTGDTLSVMITSHAEPDKAIPVSSRVLVKGRHVILTPGAPGINVSRQIKDPEIRARLVETVSTPAKDVGVIIRSSAATADPAVVAEECAGLAPRIPDAAPQMVIDKSPPAIWSLATAMRDWTTPLPDMIAAPEASENLLDWETYPGRFHFDPDLADAVRYGDGDPFDHFGVWDEIDRLRRPRADLPSGAWMAIEATRAMVTVDVNTGDQFGGGAAMTANVEAARELPRQLRLRGLGGQVIIDFAPMKKMHRKKIEETLKIAFRRDPIDTTLAGWTPLGNFELQRKRERRPLTELL